MKCLKFNIVFVLVFLLVGCSHVKKLDKSGEYKNSVGYDKPLVLPKDVNKSEIEDYYPVPKPDSSFTDVSLLPPRIIN